MRPNEGDDRTATDARLADLVEHTVGESFRVANEFAEVNVRQVQTRTGARLLIESPKSGQWVCLCPLELEALTWQNTATFSAMIGSPFQPLAADEPERRSE
ncbi:hypothetical protein ACFYO1_01910 [Nocardia sp. NPDC006044]|uniref:hypothetical protein n=1 Tax=Nocardia sp. NPDC006044 TaxID=3364306 RepID=UPI00369F9533